MPVTIVPDAVLVIEVPTDVYSGILAVSTRDHCGLSMTEKIPVFRAVPSPLVIVATHGTIEQRHLMKC